MTIEEFTPKHKFLICIDSDGCALDSMTIKHKKAFGRALIETWHLEDYKDKVMAEWERINLYSMTRGINRFLGLNMALNYINQNIKPIDGLADLTKFIETAKSYSNNALEEYIKSNPSKLLEECLSWSNLTNKYIKELPESSINLFKNVKDQIKRMTDNSDIAVVSSANYDAVYNEWKRLGLMDYVSVFCTQNEGTKEKCLERLSKRYPQGNVIMVGDGPGDLDAAKSNRIYFYPILAGSEDKSWKKINSYLDLFYTSQLDYCQEKIIDSFKDNLR